MRKAGGLRNPQLGLLEAQQDARAWRTRSSTASPAAIVRVRPRHALNAKPSRYPEVNTAQPAYTMQRARATRRPGQLPDRWARLLLLLLFAADSARGITSISTFINLPPPDVYTGRTAARRFRRCTAPFTINSTNAADTLLFAQNAGLPAHENPRHLYGPRYNSLATTVKADQLIATRGRREHHTRGQAQAQKDYDSARDQRALKSGAPSGGSRRSRRRRTRSTAYNKLSPKGQMPGSHAQRGPGRGDPPPGRRTTSNWLNCSARWTRRPTAYSRPFSAATRSVPKVRLGDRRRADRSSTTTTTPTC